MKEIAIQARKEIVFMGSDERLVLAIQDTLQELKNQHEVSVKVAMADKLMESKNSN